MKRRAAVEPVIGHIKNGHRMDRNYLAGTQGVSTGGGTFSHPWTAAPAWIIPRFLMGLRPLADGWRRVAIRPLPAKALASASIELLTLRGPLGLARQLGAGHALGGLGVLHALQVAGALGGQRHRHRHYRRCCFESQCLQCPGDPNCRSHHQSRQNQQL